MRTVSFYHKDTGLFNGAHLTASSSTSVDINTPDGYAAIDGHYDHLSQRIDVETKTVIDYQPPAPSVDHEWNIATKRWQLSAGAQAKTTAAQRREIK